MLGCRVLLFVRVGLDGLVLGGILDFGSINRLVIVCRVALLIGNRKGLGNRGACFSNVIVESNCAASNDMVLSTCC